MVIEIKAIKQLKLIEDFSLDMANHFNYRPKNQKLLK